MKLELHVVQNFGPSCLNRDDTGTPKDCEFGGYRRGRISSQCIKRAVRRYVADNGLVDREALAVRTRRMVGECVKNLVVRGRDKEEAEKVVANAVRVVFGKDASVGEDGLTQYLVFIGTAKLDELADLCDANWDALEKGAKVDVEVKKALDDVLVSDKAVDLGLFGRMLADLPKRNTDAACQVAHGISTNRIEVDFDFYTAVDDLNPDDTVGAGMMGTVEFDSPCYYRYATLDIDQLMENLDGDEELTKQATEAFMKGFTYAIPSGKQNTFAAHNPPSMVLAVLKTGMLWNLANAFVKPICPRGDTSLIEGSVKALGEYWDSLVKAYGDFGIVVSPVLLVDTDLDGSSLADSEVSDFDELVSRIRENL